MSEEIISMESHIINVKRKRAKLSPLLNIGHEELNTKFRSKLEEAQPEFDKIVNYIPKYICEENKNEILQNLQIHLWGIIVNLFNHEVYSNKKINIQYDKNFKEWHEKKYHIKLKLVQDKDQQMKKIWQSIPAKHVNYFLDNISAIPENFDNLDWTRLGGAKVEEAAKVTKKALEKIINKANTHKEIYDVLNIAITNGFEKIIDYYYRSQDSFVRRQWDLDGNEGEKILEKEIVELRKAFEKIFKSQAILLHTHTLLDSKNIISEMYATIDDSITQGAFSRKKIDPSTPTKNDKSASKIFYVKEIYKIMCYCDLGDNFHLKCNFILDVMNVILPDDSKDIGENDIISIIKNGNITN